MYSGMDKEDALIVFEDHIRTAEKHYMKEREMEERRRKRQERKIREAFQDYLHELHKRGTLCFLVLIELCAFIHRFRLDSFQVQVCNSLH